MSKKRAKPALRNGHPTKRIAIKTANVDVEMIPMVNWLNSYESVVTHACCQGENAEKGTIYASECDKPYVLFTCGNQIDLISILSTFGAWSKTDIEWFNERSQLRYFTEFTSRERLIEFSKSLPGFSRHGALEQRKINSPSVGVLEGEACRN